MCILGACDLTRGVLSVRYQSGINQNLYENDYDYFVFIIHSVEQRSNRGRGVFKCTCCASALASASALEERGHLGHLEIRHYCMFGRFGFKASFGKIKKSINLQVR